MKHDENDTGRISADTGEGSIPVLAKSRVAAGFITRVHDRPEHVILICSSEIPTDNKVVCSKNNCCSFFFFIASMTADKIIMYHRSVYSFAGRCTVLSASVSTDSPIIINTILFVVYIPGVTKPRLAS